MRLPLFTHGFTLNGLNLERFLNLMYQQGIPLLSTRKTSDRILICTCYSADLPAITSIVQEKGWRIDAIHPLRMTALLLKWRKRPGLPIGLVLTLVCMLALSQFVWKVDVRNAGPYQAEIVSFLHDNGYHAGIPRKSVNAKELESALTYRYPQIAWFQAYVTNMTLVVEVTEGVPFPDTSASETGDIIASRNGIVQALQVFAGTPAVKAGDVVQKGDVLIRGKERGRDEQQIAVRAEGLVLARCWDQFTVTLPLKEVKSSETGRSYRTMRIHTPWFDWPAVPETPGFLSSNLYITIHPVGGSFFPVCLHSMLYREVSMEAVYRDEQKVRKEASEAAMQRLKTALFDDEIIDKWVDCCKIEGDKLAATATAERLVDIGVFSSP